MPRLFIIANPTSCNGKALKIWPSLEVELKHRNWEYIFRWTEYPGHSRRLVDEALYFNPDIIVAMGGDGTVHEVIDEYYKKSPERIIPITALPLGTGNDWARYWHIPHDVFTWLEMIERFKLHDHDLGLVEYYNLKDQKEYSVFNNVAGMSYDAFVANYVESKKKKSKVNGFIYLFYIFRCLFMYRLQESKIKSGQRILEDAFYTINVGLCPYSGGGLQIVPHARPNIGQLAVTAVKPLSKFGVLLFSKEFYSGKIHLHPKVISFHTEFLTVSPGKNETILLEAEGEVLGRLPASFSIIRKAIKICAP